MRRLWVHESSRVIMDRLLELADKEIFLDILRDISTNIFDTSFDELIGFLNLMEAK